MSGAPDIAIRRLLAVDKPQVDGLVDLLIDCVDDGASASFMAPLAPATARAFWTKVADDVAAGDRALLVAEDDAGIVGTVQLVLAQPENQPHRAELVKLLVHHRARRRGLGERLMRAAEALARDCDKTLLVLDTVPGSDAERSYDRLGVAARDRVEDEQRLVAVAGEGFRGTHQAFAEAPSTRSMVDEELDQLGSMRLVLGLGEHELDGPDDARIVLRNEQRPVAGGHVIGDLGPERVRGRRGKRGHEAGRCAVVDAIDQDVDQTVDLGLVDREESADGDVRCAAHVTSGS